MFLSTHVGYSLEARLERNFVLVLVVEVCEQTFGADLIATNSFMS